MAEGIRLMSINRGVDPREYALVALGGAGPLHACALAEELYMTRVVIPSRPGVLSVGSSFARCVLAPNGAAAASATRA